MLSYKTHISYYVHVPKRMVNSNLVLNVYRLADKNNIKE